MKAKKRVVTSGRPPGVKRTPTVRRIRPAIVPAESRPRPRPTAAPPATGDRAAAVSGIADHRVPAIDLSVELGRGLVLANPIVAAAGPFGYGVEVADDVDLGRLGALVTRATTLHARAGGSAPRMIRVRAGILHAIGLQNPGIDVVVERFEPAWRRWRVPVLVNVAGESTGEIVEVVHRLEGLAGVAGVELSLGFPGGRGATDPGASAALTGAVRRATDLPLIVKLSPVAADLRALARAVAGAGADALSAVNALPAIGLDDARERTRYRGAQAGLSGPAILPIALRMIDEIAPAVSVPVLAMGGVATLDDVLDFLALGATAVAIGTAAFADPGLPMRLADELADECRRRGLSSHRPLVGSARR